VDLQNVKAGALIGVWELNLAVNAPRAQQRWVQDVDAVGGHEDL
jgi:hypothetical protein